MSPRVRREGGEVLVGRWPSHPERTALLEARGALLAWDVLADLDPGPGPAARVHDTARAADWLWEVYGPDAAARILAAAESEPESESEPEPESESGSDQAGPDQPGPDRAEPDQGDPGAVRRAARTVAHLTWARSWWPASASAGVPALDPVLLHAELALATAAVEHLLDDEDATARALAEVTADPVVEGVSARLAALAEDYGFPAPQPLPPTRAEYALAAGDAARADGVTVHSGSDPVDWALVPAGAVDAAAGARWAVVRSGGGTHLDVVVAAGPRPDVRLAARFGGVEVALDRTDGLGRRTGRAPVPPTVLLLPPAQRRLTVYAPDFAVPPAPADPDAAERRAAITAYARSRPGSPSATLTERLAGRR